MLLTCKNFCLIDITSIFLIAFTCAINLFLWLIDIVMLVWRGILGWKMGIIRSTSDGLHTTPGGVGLSYFAFCKEHLCAGLCWCRYFSSYVTNLLKEVFNTSDKCLVCMDGDNGCLIIHIYYYILYLRESANNCIHCESTNNCIHS